MQKRRKYNSLTCAVTEYVVSWPSGLDSRTCNPTPQVRGSSLVVILALPSKGLTTLASSFRWDVKPWVQRVV